MSQRRMLTLEDTWAFRLVTEMRLAPDGRRAAFTLETQDKELNAKRSAIWLLERSVGEARQFSGGTKQDSSPRWSADGRWLAFLSDREGEKSQVWVMPADGGEARKLTNMKNGVSEFCWSPDGAWIALTSEVKPDGKITNDAAPKDAKAKEREERDEAERLRVVTRLQFRWDGRGLLEGRSHLFKIGVESGELTRLTEGDYQHSEPAWSPDGRWIVFCSDRAEDRDANLTQDLWLIDPETREERRLTDGTTDVSAPAWSPDGQAIAYLMTPVLPRNSATNTHVMVISREGGASRDLSGHLDFDCHPAMLTDLFWGGSSTPQWSADGAWLYAVVTEHGSTNVFRFPTAGGDVEHVTVGEHHISMVAVTPDGKYLLTLWADPENSWDLYEYTLEDAPASAFARRLTAMNAALLDEVALATPERFTFTGPDDWAIDGWLYRPHGAEPGKRYPLVLWIHGGPFGSYGSTFYLWAQVLAARGYAALYVNPRGSSGSGEAFAQAVDFDWGGKDYEDIMAGVDAAIARGGIDPDRMAVTGGSYGGYMTNWIIGHTNRFKAAVTLNSVTNLTSSFGTGDIDSTYAERQYGLPWEAEAVYRERSPITYAPQITTPTRIIHAENDYRCPIEQGEQLYVWLKKLGRAPVEFIRVPRSSHTFNASPRQRLQVREKVFEWIERYVPAGPRE
ncbi:MAG TPA: S9 family peptidase, partial [Ktedonobacterales bacterium]|nr:S9 family peptidase [Ktedonobacterales bacterium]